MFVSAWIRCSMQGCSLALPRHRAHSAVARSTRAFPGGAGVGAVSAVDDRVILALLARPPEAVGREEVVAGLCAGAFPRSRRLFVGSPSGGVGATGRQPPGHCWTYG